MDEYLLSIKERRDIEIITSEPQPISSKALMTTALAEDSISMFKDELISIIFELYLFNSLFEFD